MESRQHPGQMTQKHCNDVMEHAPTQAMLSSATFEDNILGLLTICLELGLNKKYQYSSSPPITGVSNKCPIK